MKKQSMLFIKGIKRGEAPLRNSLPSPPKESQREAKPLLYNQFPLSFEGEGDKGGEDDKQS